MHVLGQPRNHPVIPKMPSNGDRWGTFYRTPDCCQTSVREQKSAEDQDIYIFSLTFKKNINHPLPEDPSLRVLHNIFAVPVFFWTEISDVVPGATCLAWGSLHRENRLPLGQILPSPSASSRVLFSALGISSTSITTTAFLHLSLRLYPVG